ncbi:MAG: leucyl/phenylalanyl-tRNA--protein transferase [Acidimicrobiales bacterium]
MEPGTLLNAYRHGIFPMPVGRRQVGWWSPDPRAIVPFDRLRVTRSLRRSLSKFEVRLNTAFVDVIHACADPRRDGGWITPAIVGAYAALHDLGWAHSVETWRDGELVGGLYGVAIGGLFAGESMFHHENDASKVALVALVEMLRSSAFALLDVQWCTPHLASLGAVEISRRHYLELLRPALEQAATALSWPALPRGQ